MDLEAPQEHGGMLEIKDNSSDRFCLELFNIVYVPSMSPSLVSFSDLINSITLIIVKVCFS